MTSIYLPKNANSSGSSEQIFGDEIVLYVILGLEYVCVCVARLVDHG